jgi:hypothetical protein
MQRLGKRRLREMNEGKIESYPVKTQPGLGIGGFVEDFFGNAKQTIRSWFSENLGPKFRLSNAGSMGRQAVAGMRRQALEAFIAAAKELAKTVAPPLGALGSASLGGPAGALYRRLWAVVKRQFPSVNLHSAFRPGARTLSGALSMHAQGRAIDISPRMDIFNWIRSKFGGRSHELIFTPAGGRQIYRGRPHIFDPGVAAMHWDHIHWSMRNGAYIKKPFRGMIQAAESHPEIVSPVPIMEKTIRKVVREEMGMGGEFHFYIDGREIEFEVRRVQTKDARASKTRAAK